MIYYHTVIFFFFNDTATTEIYTLSLHDALPISDLLEAFGFERILVETVGVGQTELDIAGSAETTVLVLVPESGDGIQTLKAGVDRKSTRLNSSHGYISYAVFCLKKKKNTSREVR